MRVALHATAGPNAGVALVFDRREAVVLGRADPRLPHPDPYLGRRHVLIEADPPACRVTDLGSRNGTFVNGGRVAHAALNDGDELRAGRTTFRVVVGPAPALDDTLADAPPVPPPAETGSYHPPPEPDAEPGTQVSRRPAGVVPGAADAPAVFGYRVVREVGRGGMGAVYEAVREADGRTVALKVIRPDVAPSAVAVGRFLRETAVLRQIDHPAIVRHLDNGEDGGVIWLAMEFVPGTNAAKKVRAEGPLKVATGVRVVVQVLKALAHAHGLGFVHRDVKPSNVLLDRRAEDGKTVVKLADFGLARVYQASQLSGLTLAGQYGGTPAFMPPEQVTDFRNVGPPADVYGAAATLYHLLAGAPVFDLPADTRAAFDVILGKDPAPLRDRRPEVPEVLAAVVHAALAKDPAHRPPSAQALADALKPFAT